MQTSQQNRPSNRASPPGGGGGGGGGGPPGSNSNNGGASRRKDEKEMEKILSERLSSKEPHVVSVAMEALAELLFIEDDDDDNYNQKTAFSYGAPLAIVRAMNDNQDSGYAGNIWLNGCWSLAYIAVVNQSQKVILGTGGLNACLLAMDKHPQSSAIHSACCYLIALLLRCPNSRKAVIDQGGLAAVMQAMENHKQDYDGVQTNASYALLNLITFSQAPNWMKTAVDAGGIEAVIEAMESHGDCAKLQLNGCLFLETLAKSHEDYRERILQAKGLVPVGEAIRIHQNNADILAAARDANIAIIGP